MTVNDFINQIEQALVDKRHVQNAKQMEAYLKQKFIFYGLKAPVRKEIFKRLWTDHKEFIKINWKPLSLALWQKDQREYQYITIDMLSKVEKKLDAEDIIDIEFMITHKSWWDTVDFLASHCIGQILKKDKELMYEKADSYINSSDMWLQRTGIIFQLF